MDAEDEVVVWPDDQAERTVTMTEEENEVIMIGAEQPEGNLIATQAERGVTTTEEANKVIDLMQVTELANLNLEEKEEMADLNLEEKEEMAENKRMWEEQYEGREGKEGAEGRKKEGREG